MTYVPKRLSRKAKITVAVIQRINDRGIERLVQEANTVVQVKD